MALHYVDILSHCKILSFWHHLAPLERKHGRVFDRLKADIYFLDDDFISRTNTGRSMDPVFNSIGHCSYMIAVIA